MTPAVQNNNPGNLKDTNTGQYRKFNTPQEGYAALLTDLQAKQSGNAPNSKLTPDSTLLDFASMYAPDYDKNNVGEYTANLANQMKVRPDTKLRDLNLQNWAAAVAHNEDKNTIFGNLEMQPTPSSQTPSQVPFSQNQPPPSFLSEAGQDIGEAGKGVASAASRALTGQINPVSGLVQGVGALAGGFNKLTSSALEHIPVVGGLVKGAENLIGSGVQKLAQTGLGQKVVKGYEDWSQKNPELSADIGAGIDIATAIPILKGIGIAKNVIGSGLKSVLKGSVEKVIPKLLEEEVPSLANIKAGAKKGLISIGKKGPELAPDTQKALSIKYLTDEVKAGNIPKNGSATHFIIGAETAADKEAINLGNMLRKSEIQKIVQSEDLQYLQNNVIKRAGGSIVSGENPAQTLMKVFTDNLPQGRDILAEDVLNARRAVGQFIRENRGDWSQRGVLTGFKSARNAFWDESRDLLKRLAPDIPVEQSLEKQTALYRVSDYLAPKVKKEFAEAVKNKTFLGRHPLIKGALKYGTRAAVEGTGVGTFLRMTQ